LVLVAFEIQLSLDLLYLLLALLVDDPQLLNMAVHGFLLLYLLV
jgi:hypothetical protein